MGLLEQGVEDLLEHLDYIAELLELQADDTIPATGYVVEARMSTRRGAVATVLIKEGRLDKGDVVLAGSGYGDGSGKRLSRGQLPEPDPGADRSGQRTEGGKRRTEITRMPGTSGGNDLSVTVG